MEKPRITAKIAGRALHPLLRPFVIGYFFAACACDLVYSQASIFAQNDAGDFASITEWLLGAGLVAAGLTALVALIDFFGEQRFRRLPDAWMYGVGGVLVTTLACCWRCPAKAGRACIAERSLRGWLARPSGR